MTELPYKWKGGNDVQLYSKPVSFQEKVSRLKMRYLFVWVVKAGLCIDSSKMNISFWYSL